MKDKNSTILVTGGAGYIGSITVRKLIQAGYKVVVLDSLENGHGEAVDNAAILEVFDISDKVKLNNLFSKYHFDAVIDFAAYLAVGESMEDPKKYLENNVYNFLGLLDVMTQHNCKCIIKSSTASTYGNPEKEEDFPLKESYTETFKPAASKLFEGKWEDESLQGEAFFQKVIADYDANITDPKLKLTDSELTKLRIPTSVYGLSKLLDEIVMKKYDEQSGLKYITLRYFNVAGADPSGTIGEDKPNPTNLMTVTIYQALGKRDKLEIFGDDYPTKDGTGIRDYIHVCDLAMGHVKALDYLLTTKQSETINLGTGTGFSVFEVIAAVEKASGKKIDYEIVARRSGDPVASYANPDKASQLLGWKAKYSLDDMAKSAWKWHSTHPNGYRR